MYAGESKRAPLAIRPAAPVQVFLLGRFEVVREDGPIPADAWRRRRPADLLKLVALAPGRSLGRDEAIRALWPDKDEASGANNLHRALYDLRQIVGGRWVDLDHGRIFLSDDVWLDVDEFERAATMDDPDRRAVAAALYRGDLCPDDPETPWLADRRRRLRARMAETALPLAHDAAERGEGDTALSLLRHVLAVTPHHAASNLLAMRVLAQQGRRADALRQYDACERALRAEGLPPPEPALRALRDDIQAGRVGPSRASAPPDGQARVARRLLGTSAPAPLRGRTASLVLFESLVERGWGSLVLLGERGVGTSRLAVEGARIAHEAGAVVLSGTFDRGDGVPWSCFADAFADHARAGGAVVDPFTEAGGGAPGVRADLLESVRARLAEIGGGRPVYLVIEDLHAADESSANLFHFLARSAAATRLMLVATCREDALHAGTPAQMLVSHLDCERLARGVRVPRLDLAASRALIADVIGTDPGEPLALRLYRLTDGSPFYLEELARAFRESGHVKVPEDPVAAVRERVGRLGPRAVSLLEAGAVMGRRFELEVVIPATGLSAHDSLLVLDEVLQARVVDHDGTAQRFHQSLVRDALYDGLPPDRRASLHRAIADALEERAARTPLGIVDAADQLARHRRAGNQPDRAFVHFVTAGHRARERGGLREACAFYEAAHELCEPAGASGPQRLELLEGLGSVQLALGELPGALRTFEAAMSLVDPSGWRPGPELRARVWRQSATALLVAGRSTEGRAALERGLADALLGTGDERAELLSLQALVDWCEGERDAPPEMEPFTPEPAVEVHLALWQQQLAGSRGAPSLERQAATLRERAARRDSPTTVALARAVEAALAARGARFDLAEAAAREARAGFRREGCSFGEAFALETLGDVLTARGRTEEALAVLGDGMLVAERSRLRRHALLGMHAALARNRLVAGATWAAEEAVAQASALASRHGECAACHALFLPEAIRVHLVRGRIGEAEEEADALLAFAQRRGGAHLVASARCARGRVDAARGRPTDAASSFLEAAGTWEPLGNLVAAAHAWSLAATALRAAGPARAGEADALVERAVRVLGCAPAP